MPDARAILITGASTGIGEACALELDRRGFRVFAGVRSAEAGEALRSKASSNLVGLHLDVTDPTSIAEAADAIDTAVGASGLWGLVNNAGIVVHGPVEIVSLDELRRQFEVNVIGQVAVTQKMLRLVRRARGRIVNMGSVSGFVAAPHLGPYAASKHALEALTDSLRIELARFGIGVSIVEPQSIQTPIWRKARASADTLVRGLTPQAEELYGKEMRLVGRAVERFEARGLPVERVVRAVIHALTAPKPKPRYPVGLQTRLAYLLWHLLPTPLRDAILRRETGLG
jgi:NAD(P)-dependent dehydrogenase (short-subunit alcohol dehydrogenase family)